MICNIVTFVNSCHIEVYRNDIPSAEPRTPKKEATNIILPLQFVITITRL